MTQDRLEDITKIAIAMMEDKMGSSFGPNIHNTISEILLITLMNTVDDMRKELKAKAVDLNNMQDEAEIANALLFELSNGDEQFGRHCCMHHGMNVIREEFEEMWDNFKEKIPNKEGMERECIQLGAMCIKFLRDCIDRSVDMENETY